MEIEKLITKITEILDKTYKENYDLQLIIENDEHIKYELFFKFPKVTIRNSKNLSMELVNLYFKIPLKYIKEKGTLSVQGGLKGTRSELSYKEYLRHYTHSHLDSGGLNGFTNVCLGNSDLRDIISDLSVDDVSRSDFMTFELFANMLYSLAEWESLEGTPYNYIKDVLIFKNENVISASEINLLDSVDSFLDALVDLAWSPEFTFDSNTMKFSLIKNEEFEKVLLPFTTVYVAKDSGNYYYNPIPNAIDYNDSFINEGFSNFLFKGVLINQHINAFESNDIIWPENLPKYVNRQFFNAIVSELENRSASIFKKLIHYNYDRREKEELQKRTDSIKRIKSENLIPVLTDR